MSLRALCPHCQTVCELDDPQLTVAIPCPSCGGRFVLHRPAAAPALPDEKLAGAPLTPAPPDSEVPPLSLQGGPPLAWIDRVLPRRPSTFLAVVFGIAAACWLLGLLLADDRARFLRTREWYAQLLYLPAHLITLRLFVTLYTRNFLAGVAHMNVPLRVAVRGMRLVLGPAGLLALVFAAPLCADDYRDLSGEKYADSRVGPVLAGAAPDPSGQLPHAVGPADLLMWGIWCLEWVVNAYIWVLLLGFLLLTMYVLRWFSFREPVEVVLHEKHYRPFLLMSGQGATIVLGFAVVNGLYIWFAGGDITDYIGIGVTVALLLLGFGPPWLQLKSTVERVVNGEIYQLRAELIASHRRQAALEKGGTAPPDLTARMHEALIILRIDYLDRLGRQMGRSEGTIFILKILVPTATIGWRLLRSFLGLP